MIYFEEVRAVFLFKEFLKELDAIGVGEQKVEVFGPAQVRRRLSEWRRSRGRSFGRLVPTGRRVALVQQRVGRPAAVPSWC